MGSIENAIEKIKADSEEQNNEISSKREEEYQMMMEKVEEIESKTNQMLEGMSEGIGESGESGLSNYLKENEGSAEDEPLQSQYAHTHSMSEGRSGD